ncbi:trigger factor [Candidatus Parcubacteria bacterium]|jgi:trigger factor|nr:trigger factor [Candidatus Parcubacteria bacterium]MBT7227884.1 trigger factor [Candidatus Parcubacteria bacterium]
MKITKKDLEKKEIELTIEVSLEEIKPHLQKAAEKISTKSKIPGFRPGKAPYDLVKSNVGEMAIWQEAMDSIISDTFFKAVTREKLETVGQPDIKVEKLAPGNPIVYKATVALLPKVTLGEWQKVSVKKKEVKVEEEEINKTIDQLKETNVKEVAVDRKAKKADKLELDFEVLREKVIIEGGKNPKYPIVIGEGKMIPGFEDKLIGLKKGDKKEFELKFPDKYFQKNLAGKLATFKIEVINVYERELPTLDDSFAKTTGFDTLDKLKDQIKKNILQDKEGKEKQRVEGEAIQKMVDNSTIEDIPNTLIKNEVHKMIHELEHSITGQGMDMAGYLKSINKTHDDLHKDFEPQAMQRIQAALMLRQFAQEEKITTTDEDIDREIKKQEEMYKDNPQAMQNIQNPGYRQHLLNLLTNQKVIQFISEKIIT